MRILHQQFQVNYQYPVYFGRGWLKPENHELANFLLNGSKQQKTKVLVFVDGGVSTSNPDFILQIEQYFQAQSDLFLVAMPFEIPGGEQIKDNQEAVDQVLTCVDDYGIDRQSYVLAIGGGAFLDAVGFAASLAHRGVRLVRMPTTVLAQNDAGIGVKNGINQFGKKNFTGNFAPPFAVFNDFELLNTLDDRHFKAGIAEAIKVALIKDAAFFAWLEQHAEDMLLRQNNAVEYMIEHCAALHLEHIRSGDPFETGSSRPLDYGHWSAHKLEKLTSNQVLHGEAVAFGMAVDAQYAQAKGWLNPEDGNRILALLQKFGFILQLHKFTNSSMNASELLLGLEEFREHLGGNLCISMLTGIGSSQDVSEIDMEVMEEVLGA